MTQSVMSHNLDTNRFYKLTMIQPGATTKYQNVAT